MDNALYRSLYFETQEWGNFDADHLRRENCIKAHLRSWSADGHSDAILELTVWAKGKRIKNERLPLNNLTNAKMIRFAINTFDDLVKDHPSKDLLK